MQLVAYGAQDLYLTHEPQITFFKVVYRRHTNFSVESIEQTVNGTVSLQKDVTVTISRNGDLVNNILLEMTTSAPKGSIIYETGHGFSLIGSVTLTIGGQEIDKQYGHWMQVWSDLTNSANRRTVLGKMIDAEQDGSSAMTDTTTYVPLQFWFCRDNGLALPLIALQYHEVKLKISFAADDETGAGKVDNNGSIACRCYADYVFLDTDERRKFAQTKHEYLIEQTQQYVCQVSTGKKSTTSATLVFNHPVKELVWFVPPVTTAWNSNAFNDYNASWMASATLRLNNTLRFSSRKAAYFNWVQPDQHHTGLPKQGTYVYSFALNPEKHQPSGTCNFSRIDSAILEMTRSTNDFNLSSDYSGDVHIYAHNYNVLRIMSGMGGLAYSN
jgi:hypothetical protein